MELIIENIDFLYKFTNSKIFDKYSCQIKQGEIVGIVGENGVGKTTLGKLLCGQEKLSRGEVYITTDNNQKILINSPKKVLKIEKVVKYLGFMFQNVDYQIFSDNVKEEIIFPLQLSGKSKEEQDIYLTRVVNDYEMQDIIDLKISALSLGQKQKLAIVLILLQSRNFYFFDEPTSNLDTEKKKWLSEKLLKLKSTAGVILVSHDIDFARGVCDRFIELKNNA